MNRAASQSAYWWPGPVAIALVFLVAVLPFVIWPLDPQPDERRYSIAAAQMLATGDYLVPVTENGDLRLTKPPLTYYYIVAGFALLGQTLIGAKLFFLVSAAAIVVLCYPLARALGSSPLMASLAAAMMAGNRAFFTASTQYMPDTPLLLGITAALLGFVHVLQGMARPWHLYLACIGIAWAILAKGFLALLLVVIYVAVRCMPSAPKLSLELRRHELIAGMLCVAICVPWFALMALWHWDALLAQFFGDQVTRKAQLSAVGVANGMFKTSSTLVLLSLPGLLAIALAHRAAGTERVAHSVWGAAVLFLLAWIVLNITLFAFSNKVYGRYALPAGPAVMALAAAFATTLPMAALAAGLRRALRILLPILSVTLAFGGVLGAAFGAVGWGVAGILLAIFVLPWAWWALARRPFAVGLIAVALFFPAIELARLPVAQALLLPTAGQVAAKRIAALGPRAGAIYVNGNAKLLDQIGVALGDFGRTNFSREIPEPLNAALVIFLDPGLRAPLEAAGYTVERVSVINGIDVPGDKIIELVALGDLAAVREAISIPLFFATSGP